ncbi:hypothetical protein BC936DRAFT_148900, partial [Jimgerdemannia flammicorona]
HLEAPPKELLLAQTENYVEYSRTGKLVKGLEKLKAKSKYDEDVHPYNHTTIWGSYWADGRWGYKCCRSFNKNAYCTGLAGIEAAKAATAAQLLGEGSASFSAAAAMAAGGEDDGTQKTLLEQHLENKKKNRGKDKDKEGTSNPHLKRKDLGEGDVELDQHKLKKALRELDEKKRGGEKGEELDERKRKYNSAYASGKAEEEVTEEQLEAYRLRRQHYDDPMTNYKDDDDD